MGKTDELQRAIQEATWKLIDCVERYVRQDCSRSTLLSRKEFLKRLMENETNLD